MKVLIAGGGIGGLCAALSLAKGGHQVELLEQAPEFVEAGAGIQLSPNCSRVLHYLGLKQALRDVAFLPEATQFRHWRSGIVIGENRLGVNVAEEYGAPYYHIHRGDLLGILVQAAVANSSITLHNDAQVLGFIENKDQVQLSSKAGEFSADLLVGADGIHSIVRATLWGAEEANFTGNVAWRALVPTARLPTGLVRPMSTAWWGPGKHFVHYYVRGGELINCVCVVEKTGWTRESWTEPGELRELKADFAGWHSDIERLISEIQPDSLFKWALYDREPLPRWSQGRVTLLGDACHPTLPFMAQGAAMAIEDAAVLANCVTDGSDVTQQLASYEGLRRTRTAGIQRGSRRNAKVFHLRGFKAWARNRAVRAAGSRAMEGLFRYNALEAKP